jgi:hypothetical protein
MRTTLAYDVARIQDAAKRREAEKVWRRWAYGELGFTEAAIWIEQISKR